MAFEVYLAMALKITVVLDVNAVFSRHSHMFRRNQLLALKMKAEVPANR
jgi:hypothetical protein